MTTLDKIELPSARMPERIGQHTAVEQARAVAEVHAAVQVARQHPRHVPAALAAIRESCTQQALAERAFYRFPRGGEAVSGETIHLARELARSWGNIDYGIKELSRTDTESEMLAYAWDLETNTRSSNAFVAPHKRDTKKGLKPLVDLRDIYENNSNLGARRVRECIFAVLPTYVIEQAKEWCANTLRDGGGKPLAQRVADAVKAFDGIGIVPDQLEQKIGRKSDRWTELDVAQLGVTFKSLQRGEVTRDEEFPTARVTAAEIAGQAAEPPAAAEADPEPSLDGELWPAATNIPGGED